jgi:chemotaxis response regulator CheB
VVTPIKVFLADDSEIMRRGIRQLLASQTEIEVVGEAADFRQTVQMANDLKPQVIVLDLHMPNETKIAPQDFKSHLIYGSQLIAISIWNDEPSKRLAEDFGAVLLDKTDLGSRLIPTILQVGRKRGMAA